MIIIGFDSEWVYLPNENRNHILSYQFSVLTPNSECSGIVYTDGPDLKHRWKLADLLGHAIQVARDEMVACPNLNIAISKFKFLVTNFRFDEHRGQATDDR